MAVRRGVVLVFVLIFIAMVMSMGFLFLLSMAGGAPPSVPQNATLYLPIQAPLAEVEPSDVFSQFVSHRQTLASTVDAIRKAKRDTRVKTLVFTPSAAGALWGQLQEVRAALDDFKTSGKPLVAYLEFGGAQEYYLASAANRVVLMPAGQLDLTGLATYELFFRGALDKLGVLPDLLHVGDYKTAVEHVHRAVLHAGPSRDVPVAQPRLVRRARPRRGGRRASAPWKRCARLIDDGPYLPEAALQAGLVDQVAYDDQLDDDGAMQGTQRLEAAAYSQVVVPGHESRRGARIALLYAVGTIATGKSSFEGAGGLVVGSQTFVEWLRKVRVDPTMRAIVVRIDSPGGSAIASEVIWRELMLTRGSKPLIVSHGRRRRVGRLLHRDARARRSSRSPAR